MHDDIESIFANEGYHGPSQDRVAIIELDDRIVIALADGAGISSEKAAEAVIESIRRQPTSAWRAADEDTMCALLRGVDLELSRIGGAETTAVVCMVGPDRIIGASVGDSGACLIDAHGWRELTALQVRKPLLGSGTAIVTPFNCRAWKGTLLVASDGLLKYAPVEKLCAAASDNSLAVASKSLIDAARLRSGGLPDDVSLALCRKKAVR